MSRTAGGCGLGLNISYDFVSLVIASRSVDRCVTTPRSKIEPDDPDRPIYIETIRDIGYRFEGHKI